MIETLSEHRCFGGIQGFYRHASTTIGLPMRFSVYRPPESVRDPSTPLPVLIFLAGLTCTEETFPAKAAAQQWAARHGVMLLAPDTSPRDTGIEGADASWDFGTAASFYLDATEEPWRRHWRMETYLMDELLPLMLDRFNGYEDRVGIFGHSMGGHGALTLALRHPGRFESVSAFAPIASPTRCPWGRKALQGYLGGNQLAWARHDATELIKSGSRCPPLLIDQGLADKFLAEQLHPDLLEAACQAAGQPLTLRRHDGFDHGYYFIASFMRDHLVHHAQALLS